MGSDLPSTNRPLTSGVGDSTSAGPSIAEDGSISAIVQGPSGTGPLSLLRLLLPPNTLQGAACGRFFMVRCTEDTPDARRDDWSFYLRRPLLVAGLPGVDPSGNGQRVDLLPISVDDPGIRWLLARPPESKINLLGPFGQPFALPTHSRALLILADLPWLPVWLPAVHTMLDQGGRVTLVLRDMAEPSAVLPVLPLAAELRTVADASEWTRHLSETLRWADVAGCALPPGEYQALADQIRLGRFRLERDFAHAFVPTDLACGFGACLACVVPLPDGGMTRACLHGPIFPLERLIK